MQPVGGGFDSGSDVFSAGAGGAILEFANTSSDEGGGGGGGEGGVGGGGGGGGENFQLLPKIATSSPEGTAFPKKKMHSPLAATKNFLA